MSDLAIVDVESPEQPQAIKPFAVVGPFRDRDAGTDATLAALLGAIPGEPVAVAGPASSSADNVIDFRNRRAVSRAISKAEAVLIVAPTFGVDLTLDAYLARLTFKAKLRGQVVAFLAASAQQATSKAGRTFARTAIHNADLTILRDEESADALVASGVEPPLRIGADPAWNELGQLFAAPQQNDNVVVALDHTSDVDLLADALAPVAASGIEVVLQPWSEGSGQPVAERVADRLGGNASVLQRPTSLREARDVYSTSRAVLALRFHAVMAAACAGSPTLALGDSGMERLASTLGLPVVPASASAADIAAALIQTLEHGPVGSRAVPQLIDRAKASVDLVRLLLTEGEDTSQSANNPLPLYPTPWRQ